jgi:hypothetical protein
LAKDFVEADMQEQIYLAKRPNPQFANSDEQQARDAWKRQLDDWLHEYRDRYVLKQRDEKSAPPP